MASPRFYNRLAFRIAVVVMCVVFLAEVVVAIARPAPRLVSTILVPLVAGGVSYVYVYTNIARRIKLARKMLRKSQKRSFGVLSSAPRRNARDELDALVYQTYRSGRALQKEIERLKQLENYRTEYLGDVFHELRTPIFAISGFAETLLNGALEDEEVRRRFVEKIEANARRLDALARDLAEISRIETGELRMTKEPFDLKPIVQETAESLGLLAHDRHIELTVQLPPSVPRVVGDRERIRQVLANLVENAIKYNKPGGRVEVIVRSPAESSVNVAVVDNGIGVPSDTIPRLTERFFRVDKSRSREQGGTGLGLAIVKHILQAHGERLEIESRPNYGSKFAFKLSTAAAPNTTGASLKYQSRKKKDNF